MSPRAAGNDSHYELAWAAGFWDGEGCMNFTDNLGTLADGSRKRYRQWHAVIGQKNRRVLDRFQKAVGMGKVYGPYKSSIKNLVKPPEETAYNYQWRVGSVNDVTALGMLLWPWLSEEKREQIVTKLDSRLERGVQ